MTQVHPVAPSTRCPRCAGRLSRPDADGDTSCTNCGAVVYAKAVTVGPRPTPPEYLLSPRQRELMHWVAMGATNRLICLNLDIALPTLKMHLRTVRDRLGLGPGRNELEHVARQLERLA